MPRYFLLLAFEVCSCESTVLNDFWCHFPFCTVNFAAFFLILFSGSHIENWHSILRNGLVVASNTRLQVNRIKQILANLCMLGYTLALTNFQGVSFW